MARSRGGNLLFGGDFTNNMRTGVYVLFGILVVLIIVVVALKLKKEYFGNPNADDGATITFYYMEGCGWCKKAKPEWEKCKEMAPSKNIKTNEISADQMTPADKQKGINGFPTFIVTINGVDKKYEGERDAKSMLNYVDQLRLGGMENFKNAGAEKFIKTGKP
jgi:glutaredoxin